MVRLVKCPICKDERWVDKTIKYAICKVCQEIMHTYEDDNEEEKNRDFNKNN